MNSKQEANYLSADGDQSSLLSSSLSFSSLSSSSSSSSSSCSIYSHGCHGPLYARHPFYDSLVEGEQQQLAQLEMHQLLTRTTAVLKASEAAAASSCCMRQHPPTPHVVPLPPPPSQRQSRREQPPRIIQRQQYRRRRRRSSIDILLPLLQISTILTLVHAHADSSSGSGGYLTHPISRNYLAYKSNTILPSPSHPVSSLPKK